MSGEIVLAACVPHTRHLIGGPGEAPEATLAALHALGRRLVEARPDVLVVIDPHAPGAVAGAFGLFGAPTLRGSLAHFEAPQLGLELRSDVPLQYLIGGLCQEIGLPLVIPDRFRPLPLSHGTIIPLQLLAAVGASRLPVVVISQSDLPLFHHHQLGQVIAYAARRSGSRVAVLASGGLSHRHEQDPEAAAAFDERVLQCLSAGDWHGLLDVAPSELAAAGDCGTRALAVLAGLGHRTSAEATAMAYEVAHGSGLLVAELAIAPEAPPDETEVRPGRDVFALADLALEALYCRVAKGETIRAAGALSERFAGRRTGAFISLFHNGKLRDSLGSVLPLHGDVCEDVIQAAVTLAGMPGPDGRRLGAGDLPGLTLTVHLVGELEPVDRIDQVDPARYGLVASNGFRHGVLLPGSDGIETPQDQVDNCLKKLGLMPGEPVWLYRFAVETSNSWDPKPLTAPKRR